MNFVLVTLFIVATMLCCIVVSGTFLTTLLYLQLYEQRKQYSIVLTYYYKHCNMLSNVVYIAAPNLEVTDGINLEQDRLQDRRHFFLCLTIFKENPERLFYIIRLMSSDWCSHCTVSPNNRCMHHSLDY